MKETLDMLLPKILFFFVEDFYYFIKFMYSYKRKEKNIIIRDIRKIIKKQDGK